MTIEMAGSVRSIWRFMITACSREDLLLQPYSHGPVLRRSPAPRGRSTPAHPWQGRPEVRTAHKISPRGAGHRAPGHQPNPNDLPRQPRAAQHQVVGFGPGGQHLCTANAKKAPRGRWRGRRARSQQEDDAADIIDLKESLMCCHPACLRRGPHCKHGGLDWVQLHLELLLRVLMLLSRFACRERE